MSDSTVLTIGTALYRAWSSSRQIDVLVNNAGWLSGTVVGLDGHGVVFQEAGDTHLVLRLEAVVAVRIESSTAQTSVDPEPYLTVAAS